MPSMAHIVTACGRTAVLTLILCTCLLVLPSVPAVSRTDHCVLPTSDTFSGYRMRDATRCEGIYGQNVAASLFALRSLTYSFADFDPSRLDTLVIGWPAAVGGDLRISGRGRKGGVYYALDTIVSASDRSFSWPAKIIKDRAFGRRHLGFMAWSRTAPELSEQERVHIPIFVAQNATGAVYAADVAMTYRLAVTPGEAFEDILVTIERLCGERVVPERARNSLGRPAYSARRLEVLLDAPARPGVYRVTLEGRREDRTLTVPRRYLIRHITLGNGRDAGVDCG